jgi:tetratricopeptide (TPR) repeat protein
VKLVADFMKKLTILVLLVLMMGCSRDPNTQRNKYFASGQKYLEDKKYEEAAIEFRNSLRLDKGHIPSYLGIAKAFQQMGDFQAAIAVYQQVLKLDGKNIPARLQLGEYMIIGGVQMADIFKQAQQMAEEVLKIEPSNVEGLILLGNAFAGQNETDKAIGQYEKALSQDAGNLKATLNLAAAQFRKKDIAKAEIVFKEALQRYPNDIQARLAAAAFYSATQRAQEAENHFRKAFDLAPSDARGLYALVSFYMSVNKIPEAENVFKEAIARKPGDREPRWGLASFYLQQGKTDMSVAALQEVLKMSKGDRASLVRLAEIYLSRNDEAKAGEEIKALLTINKDDPQARYLQGKIYRRHKEVDKAMAEFNAAIKYDASILPAYLEKANLQLMRGEMEACDTTLKEALQQNRNYIPARGAYAKLLAMRQHPQEALQQAQEVLAVLPDNEDALVARAEAFRISGKLAESRSNWVKLCEVQPKYYVYWYRLGMIEVLGGNKTAALINFRKAVELQPDFLAGINDILFLHTRDKQFDAAFAELDRLAKLSCPQDEIHRFRGQVFLSKGDMAAGELEFNKAIQINSKNYQSYILLAQLNLKRNNLQQAIRGVDQLIANNDKFAPAYLQKGYYLQLAKDIPGAVTNYRKALELDLENAVAANNLAWLFCENNINLDEGLTLARAAKKKMPEDPETAETLGWTYYKMKNYTLAVDQLLFSVNNRKQPSAQNYYRLGVAYYAKGDVAPAKQILRKSLDLDASYPGADEARKILKLP